MQPSYNAAFYFVLCSKDRLSDPLMPYAWGWEVLGDDEGEARNSLLSSLPAKTGKCHPRPAYKHGRRQPPPSLRFGQFLPVCK